MYMRLEKEDWDVLSDLAFKIAAIVIQDMEDGADPDRKPGFEEVELYSKMADQLEYMEIKYGPHPLILDTQADITKDNKEKIRLKEAARALCLPEDYDLRGCLSKELAELQLEEMGNIILASKLIEEAILDLKKGSNPEDLEEAEELNIRISSRMEEKA